MSCQVQFLSHWMNKGEMDMSRVPVIVKILAIVATFFGASISAQAGWSSALVYQCNANGCYQYNQFVYINPPTIYF